MTTQGMGALSGSREPDPSCTGSGPSGFDPERINILRKSSDALRDWMNSVVEQQKEATAWGGHYGVEHAAKDALDCAFRIAGTVVHSLAEIADILDAIAMEASQGGNEVPSRSDDSAGLEEASPNIGSSAPDKGGR